MAYWKLEWETWKNAGNNSVTWNIELLIVIETTKKNKQDTLNETFLRPKPFFNKLTPTRDIVWAPTHMKRISYFLITWNSDQIVPCILNYMMSSCYRTTSSRVFEVFPEFLIFCNLFHELLG